MQISLKRFAGLVVTIQPVAKRPPKILWPHRNNGARIADLIAAADTEHIQSGS
jgi:hypothetical protein